MRCAGGLGIEALALRRQEAGVSKAPASSFNPYSPNVLEGEFSEVRGGSLLPLCLSDPYACPPTLTPGWRELIG